MIEPSRAGRNSAAYLASFGSGGFHRGGSRLPVSRRGKMLARRGSGKATETDETALKLIVAEAAEIDMRIDALGDSLRGI